MKKIIVLLILVSNSVYSSEEFSLLRNCNKEEQWCTYQFGNDSYKYTKPQAFEFAKTLPRNMWRFLDSSFSSQYLPQWGAILGSTALLIIYDQKITKQTQRFARFLKIGNDENTKPTMNIGGHSLLRRPSDLGSAMYFIGDGWVTIGFMSGFFTTGMITKDTRTLQTASQLFQGLLMTGLVTQAIKRTTGRESPIQSSAPGGKWRFFPKTSDFQNSISKYDAFPSGHLATTMTTFTILYKNYPELTFIKPVGITLMTLLGFEMVNNSVHWASDYPLALGIGYMIGKTIVDNGRERNDKPDEKNVSFFSPMIGHDRFGMAWNSDF
jgi:hypothetical protein